MHGLIGQGAFLRNPDNEFRCLPIVNPPQSPNPKWKDHQGEPGAINFLNPPPYGTKTDRTPLFDDRGRPIGFAAGSTPVFDRCQPATSTWAGPVADSVNPAVAGKSVDLRWQGKVHAKPPSPDIWGQRDRQHNKLYRDRASWGPSLSFVSERILAARYGFTTIKQFAVWRSRVQYPAPADNTNTWRRHDVLSWEVGHAR